MYKTLFALALLVALMWFTIEAKQASSETLPDIKLYAAEKVIDKWGGGQYAYLDDIISKESMGWTVLEAHYPTGYTKGGVKSSAYGLCGFLNATWIGKKTNDPYRQIDECLVYIENRYDSPKKAAEFHNKMGWF